MNITFIITDITGQGGTERTTINLASTFAQKGDTVTIISLFKQNSCLQFSLHRSVQVLYLNQFSYTLQQGLLSRLIQVTSVLCRLKTRLRKLPKEGTIISQSFLPSLLVWLCGQAKQTIVCEHFKYGIYGPAVCKLRDSIYSKFRHLVLLTDSETELYAKKIKRISIIENMVMPSSNKSDLSSKRIISAGRLSSEKGFDLLIDAAKIVRTECPDYTIEIYGEGVLKAQLSQQIKNNSLENYVFIHDFSKNLGEVMCLSSIYVLSSRHEGQPLVMLEAMSYGMAIIAFNCSSGPETLLKSGGGILVAAEDPTALSCAIVNVAKDAALREELSIKAVEKSAQFSPHSIYNKWINLFNN